jgi:hypothetical protein
MSITEFDDLSTSPSEVPHNTPAPRSARADHPGISSGPPSPVCPSCGHSPTPFDLRLFALLDTLALLQAVLDDAKHAAEELAR